MFHVFNICVSIVYHIIEMMKTLDHVSGDLGDKTESAAVGTYQKIEDAVVGSYQKIENAVVGGYKKVEEKFSEKFLNEDGTMKTGKIGEAVMDGFQKIEEGVVGNYKKLETGIVEGFEKVTDKCVEKLFAKEGESVEDAKKRLSNEK